MVWHRDCTLIHSLGPFLTKGAGLKGFSLTFIFLICVAVGTMNAIYAGADSERTLLDNFSWPIDSVSTWTSQNGEGKTIVLQLWNLGLGKSIDRVSIHQGELTNPFRD